MIPLKWNRTERMKHTLSLVHSPFVVCCSVAEFSSVTQLCPTLWDPMDCSTPGLLVHHQLLVKGFSVPGKTRQLSILNGLRDIDEFLRTENVEDPVVIIHDAARPNLTAEFVDRCLDALTGYDGVMPVIPMKDTVYYSEDGISVDKLLDRSRIYAGQAPEVYRLRKYLEANEQLLPEKIMKINGSTEPAVLAGLKVSMIPGDENNYKVTTKKDLERFESACS